MSKIVSIHSFRGGAGKSNLTANLAYLLFEKKKKVAILDADLQSPGIHILFGLDSHSFAHTLNDYLDKKVSLKQVAVDVSRALDPACLGKLYLIPASLSSSEIAKILREGYDMDLLVQGFHQVIQDLELDYLLIDTHPGIGESTLLAISISDAVLIILRPDNQDYQGTAVAVELTKKLEVPSMYLVVNKIPPSLDPVSIEKEVAKAYDTPVAGSLSFCEEMMALASSGLFCRLHPTHPFTQTLRKILATVVPA